LKKYGYAYDVTYALHSDSIGKSTVFIWDAVCTDLNQCPISAEFIDESRKFRPLMLNLWKEYFAQFTEDLYQLESIVINSTREDIWNILTDWTVLKNIAPQIADDVQYYGDRFEIGSKIKIVSNSKNLACNLKVLKANHEEGNENWEYHLDVYDGIPSLPLQEIHFSLVNLSENLTMVIFKHVFKVPMVNDVIDSLSLEKKSILAQLKNHFES